MPIPAYIQNSAQQQANRMNQNLQRLNQSQGVLQAPPQQVNPQLLQQQQQYRAAQSPGYSSQPPNVAPGNTWNQRNQTGMGLGGQFDPNRMNDPAYRSMVAGQNWQRQQQGNAGLQGTAPYSPLAQMMGLRR